MTPTKPKADWTATEEEALELALEELTTLVSARKIGPWEVERELGNLRMHYEQKLRSEKYRREQARADEGDYLRKAGA